jgi:hypothetical protein
MRELQTEIEIEATAAEVWGHLTDLGLYSEWNPLVTWASGKMRVGEKLGVRIELPDSRPMQFKPKVTRLEEEREFGWLGHLFVPGLFDGEHIFEIHPNGGEKIRFVQREKFSGLLVPILLKSIEENTLRGFDRMNRALKQLAESDE